MLLTRINLIVLILCLASLTACQPVEQKPEQSFYHSINGSLHTYLSTDANWLIVSNQTNQIRLWNLQDQALTYIWQQSSTENNPVYLTHIAAGNHYAVTASNTEFALWDMHSGKNLGYWQVKDSNIRDIAVNRTGSKIILGKSDGKILIFNPQTSDRVTFFGHNAKINQLDLSNDDNLVLSASNDYTALLWNSKTGEIIQRFVHPNRITQVKLSQDATLAFISSAHLSAIYNTKSGKQITQLDKNKSAQIYTSAQFSKDNKLLVTGAIDRQLMLWQVQTGKLKQAWKVGIKPNNPISGAIVQSVSFGSPHQVISDSSAGMTEYWTYK